MRRINTSLLECSLYSLLYLLSLRLLDSRLRNTSLIDSDRVHSGDLHNDIVSGFLRLLVESGDRTKLVLTHMVVYSSVSTFNYAVAIQLHFLASDTATIRNSFLDSTLAHRQSFHLVQSMAFVSHGSVQDSLSQSYEVLILSHEVRFALQSDDSGELAILLSQHTTLGSLTIRTFSGDSLSFFTDNFHCLFDVAIRFGQRFLAVHHTSLVISAIVTAIILFPLSLKCLYFQKLTMDSCQLTNPVKSQLPIVFVF